MREEEPQELLDLGAASERTQGIEEKFENEELLGRDYRDVA